MAKDDLNFNLDEFVASHSQGTKHMHSPKKKRAVQSPTRAAAQQKAAEKKKAQAALKEEITAAVAEIPQVSAVADNQTKIAQAEQPALQENTAVDDFVQNTDGAVEAQSESEDIFIDAVQIDNADDIKNIENVEIGEEIAEDLAPQQPLDEEIQFKADDNEKAFSKEEPEFEAVTENLPACEQTEEEKILDPDYFFRKDVKFDMPYISPKEEAAPSEPLPKYKDRTSEISFATKRRLSDTASVGVRRLREHEKADAKVYSKPVEEERKLTVQEIELQEALRRDRELTERILRKAYEQEELGTELGIDNDISEENHADSADSQKSTKQKKTYKNRRARKHKPSQEERSLPVVQVGTADEDNSQSIIDVLENALDEDVIELEYISKSNEETHSYQAAPEKKKNKAQTFYFLVGLFFTVMSVIGIVVTAKSVINFAKNVSDDSKQKQEFAKYIYPVVVTDPAAFESVNDLSDEAIIKAALWDIIIYDDSAKYTKDASNNMYVPYIQVENHAKSLFGTTNIVHATVVFSEELTFFYDSESRMYKVPVSPQLFPNSPVVSEIDKVGERYTLTVDYQEPTPNWELMDEDYVPGIKKTMEYVLTKYNDSYTIIAINNVE